MASIHELISAFGNKKRPRPTAEDEVVMVDEDVEEPSNPADLFKAAAPKQRYHEEVVIRKFEDRPNCCHKCLYPQNYKTSVVPPTEPARKFPYPLDHFQEKAIECLESDESVLVSAHTSAGKTTVAEYAVAMSVRDKQRVIYTSPIKALSNQKFRDLADNFEDVGLLTGDVTLNPKAQIIVMTTEILRSMLYKGSELIQEMKWVIMDEVHYMRDRDRGVVWEETIILLPDTVRFVFLSATLPNAEEFAEWICRIKNQPCHVVWTDFRPTPLEHYLFPAGGNGLHLVVDENKSFNQGAFDIAVSDLARRPEDKDSWKEKKQQSTTDIEKLALLCKSSNLTPAIIFGFSKKEVENHAMRLQRTNFNSREEEELAENIFVAAMETLSEEDRKLPQIMQVLPIVKRGIGLHHGGLLPIVKEVIEILFQESLIKVLFSTETFSMGINMPAKTVVFTAVKKWDGINHRMITSGEYIQMSGRAGRRGIDTKGMVILMFDERLDKQEVKQLFTGESMRLDSHFKLSYGMILNLMRVEGITPKYMIIRSLFQFQKDRELTGIDDKLENLELGLEQFGNLKDGAPGETSQEDVDGVSKYFELMREQETIEESIRVSVLESTKTERFFDAGRVVRVKDGIIDWGFGIIIKNTTKRVLGKHNTPIGGRECYLDILLACDPLSLAARDEAGILRNPTPPHTERAIYEIIPADKSVVHTLTQAKLEVATRKLNSKEAKQILGDDLMEVVEHFKGDIPVLDPIKHILLDDTDIGNAILRKGTIVNEMGRLKKKVSQFEYLLSRMKDKIEIQTEISQVRELKNERKKVVMESQLSGMKKVLKKLGYIDGNDHITLKGRIACEISSGDELVTAELLFHNTFEDMEVDYMLAMLSCLVFEEKSEDPPPQDPKLTQSYLKIKEIARAIANVSVEAKLNIDPVEYVNKFKPQLMMATLTWARGGSFVDTCSQNIFEGTLIRSLRRLEELIRQLWSACRAIGNTKLEEKMMEALTRLRRGIVFAASLYL